MVEAIDYEQVLRDLAEAEQEPGREPGVFLRRELEQIWRVGKDTALRRAAKLCTTGHMERTKTMAANEWGEMRLCKAYRVVVDSQQ